MLKNIKTLDIGVLACVPSCKVIEWIQTPVERKKRKRKGIETCIRLKKEMGK